MTGRSTETIEEFRQQDEFLFELAAILGQQNDFTEILRIVSAKAAALLAADLALIMMINPQTQNTVKTIARATREDEAQVYRLARSNIIGWVSKKKQSFLSADLKNDPRFSKDAFEDEPGRSAMCVALQSGASDTGFLLVISKLDDMTYDEKALRLLEKMAVISAPFLSNVQKIAAYFQVPKPEAALLNQYEALGLLGKSKIFIEMLRAIDAAARCDVRVLLEGRTGTGKELVARAIHHLSARKNQPFVAIDCGAIPNHLLESELFGYKKGAFTSANFDRKGLIETAKGGTLFIDEIANLPLEMQSKLMRMLQEGEVRPLGSNETVQVDVRVIAASSTSLRELVGSGKFREDLFFRLHVYPIYIPDLNQRREDAPLLARHFLNLFASSQQKKANTFDQELLAFMTQRDWHGNIRELENLVERLVTLVPRGQMVIDASSLPPDLQAELKQFRAEKYSQFEGKSLREKVQEFEAQVIRDALIACNWNQSRCARKLQTSEKNIRYKMKVLNIRKPPMD